MSTRRSTRRAIRGCRIWRPRSGGARWVGGAVDFGDLRTEYVGIVYKGLLLRLAANMEKDRGRQEQYLKEADQLREKAKTLQKTKSAGAGAGAGAGD